VQDGYFTQDQVGRDKKKAAQRLDCFFLFSVHTVQHRRQRGIPSQCIRVFTAQRLTRGSHVGAKIFLVYWLHRV